MIFLDAINMKIRVLNKFLLYSCISVALTSCIPTYYYDLQPGEVYVDSNEEGLLPQQGTEITIDIKHILEKKTTKTTPGYSAKIFRYRVLLDGELYSYGINGTNEGAGDVIIPLIANDSYTTKSVIVEGSSSTEYSTEGSWKNWEVLFEGTQDCLKENDPLRYSGLENKRLRVDIDSTILFYDFIPGYSAEAFKRFLFDNDTIIGTCDLSGNKIKIWFGYTSPSLFNKIPQNAVSGNIKKGSIGIDGYHSYLLMDNERWYYSEFTYIGTIEDNSYRNLLHLKIVSDNSKKILHKNISFSLVD